MKEHFRTNHMLLIALIVVLLFQAGILFYPSEPVSEPAVPKNIILFIGDGMGVSHMTAAKIVNGSLNMEQFKVAGFLTTHSQSDLVTDSAAAGTALATGHKTYNSAISVSRDGQSLKTIVEYAEEHRKSTGLVVTCSLTNATPAAFAAHVDSRDKNTAIAEHIALSGIDVLFGGGSGYFLPGSAEGSIRDDDKDLMAEIGRHMTIVRTAEEFERLGDVESAAGFFSPKHLPGAHERKPRLSELTAKAIEILSKDDDGFFLMVEGSQIDWAGHRNNQDNIIAETIDFDDAVGTGLEFAKDDTQTLIVVTADHETGGFAVLNGSIDEKTVTESGFTSRNHTAAMVPVFAYGPGSSGFAGIQDNTSIGRTIIGFLQKSD